MKNEPNLAIFHQAFSSKAKIAEVLPNVLNPTSEILVTFREAIDQLGDVLSQCGRGDIEDQYRAFHTAISIFLLLYITLPINAQDKTNELSGFIIHKQENGSNGSLDGANIFLIYAKDTLKTTSINGVFRFKPIKTGKAKLIITAIGCRKVEKELNIDFSLGLLIFIDYILNENSAFNTIYNFIQNMTGLLYFICSFISIIFLFIVGFWFWVSLFPYKIEKIYL